LADLPEGGDEEREFGKACQRAGKDMSAETFRHVFSQFPYVSRLDVQGIGEPLINPAFRSMLELSARRKARIQFYTNGTLMSSKISQQLVDLQVAEVSVSLDGASASVYEFIRRGARFDRVVGNVQALVDAKQRARSEQPYIRLAMVATSHNVAEMPDLVRLAHKLGVDEVAITRLRDIAPFLSDWICDPTEMAEGIAESKRKAEELSMRFLVEFTPAYGSDPRSGGTSSRRCLWPWLSVNVTIDGFLTPCSYVPCHEGWGLGNLLETPFMGLWNAAPYRTLRRKLRSGFVEGLACESCQDQV
jgi:MoaA/NifB/PqqE/SkfB family radical SAM enzyme